MQSGLTMAALALVACVGMAAAQAKPAPRMPHAPAGKQDCLSCHRPGANENIKDTPAGHPTTNNGCPMCHRVATTLPANTPHAVTGDRANCVSCHAATATGNAPKQPASHPAHHVSTCAMCHTPAAAGS